MPGILELVPNIINKKNRRKRRDQNAWVLHLLSPTCLGRNAYSSLGPYQQAVHHRMVPLTLRPSSKPKLHFFLLYTSLWGWAISKRKLANSESHAMINSGNTDIEVKSLSAGTLVFFKANNVLTMLNPPHTHTYTDLEIKALGVQSCKHEAVYFTIFQSWVPVQKAGELLSARISLPALKSGPSLPLLTGWAIRRIPWNSLLFPTVLS